MGGFVRTVPGTVQREQSTPLARDSGVGTLEERILVSYRQLLLAPDHELERCRSTEGRQGKGET